MKKIRRKKKKNKKTNKEKLINYTEVFEIPKDVVLGETIITIIGDNEVIVENYKGILEYDNKGLKLLTKKGFIEFKGKNLNIKYLTNDELKVLGNIMEINY